MLSERGGSGPAWTRVARPPFMECHTRCQMQDGALLHPTHGRNTILGSTIFPAAWVIPLCHQSTRGLLRKAPIFLGKNSYFSFRATLTALTRPLINSPDGVSVCNVLLSLCCTYWCIFRPQTPAPS